MRCGRRKQLPRIPDAVLLEPTTSVARTPPPEGLEIREISPEESDAHVEIGAECFGMPFELARELVPVETLRRKGVRCFVGNCDGVAVATAIGATHGDAVAIFNVAMITSARGRGFGRALTVRPIADGAANGATWSYLQSSVMGLPVYKRLGYRTVETWTQFLPEGAEAF
jgi:hypothetical protein